MLARGPGGATLFRGPPNALKASQTVASEPCVFAEWSKDGALVALAHAGGVKIVAAAEEREVATLPAVGAQAVAFSPKAGYVVCFQKPNAVEDGKNMGVWDVRTGQKVFGVAAKAYSKSTWPSLQFSDDDSVMLNQVTNEVHIYRSADWSAQPCRLRIPQVSAASLSPGESPVIAAFVPESKGQPANLRIHALPSTPGQVEETQAIARKSFFRVNGVKFMWSSTGEAVLVIAQADVDVSNQSYYGETNLYYLSADGQFECQVPLQKEGPVHDVAWSPRGTEFAVVYGFMPAKTTTFDSKCKPIYDLGTGAFNMATWNPFGRFLALAGFGNLPGDISFLDRKADGKCKPMGAVRADSQVSIEWSACGRYVVTATTAPRLNVDNGFKVFNYRGEQIMDQRLDVLFSVQMRPGAPGEFEDRPQTPKGQQGTTVAAAAPVAKAAPFRPKHLQGVGSGNFSAVDKNDSGPGKYRPPGAAGGADSGPPGTEEIGRAHV